MVTRISRRGLLIAGVGCTCAGLLGACSNDPVDTTFAGWLANRSGPYYIAHRGAGTTVPEHTLPSYRAALEWGAQAIEISVVRSSDGVLYCHHDLRWERTTTLKGRTADLSSSQIDEGRVNIPRLGPRWGRKNMPMIPRLDQVLDVLAGRAVLCIEAKDDNAFDDMIEALAARSLLDLTMIKCSRGSRRLPQAHRLGLPVFAYVGASKATADSSRQALSGMSSQDAIGLPLYRDDRRRVSDSVFRAATKGDVPIWAYIIHRRHEVQHFASLGVTGFMTPALGYVAATVERATAENFDDGSIPPGVITKDPYSEWDALGWDVAGAVQVGQGGKASYVALGNLSPLNDDRYTVRVSIRAQRIPPEGGFALGFGFPDDAPAEPAAGVSGFLATIRPTGELELQRVRGVDLQSVSQTAGPPLAEDTWTTVELTVADGEIIWSHGEASTRVRLTPKGGYLHVARLGTQGHIAVGSVEVVQRG